MISVGLVKVFYLDEHKYAEYDGQAAHIVTHSRKARGWNDEDTRGYCHAHRGVLCLKQLDDQQQVEVAGKAQNDQDDPLPGRKRIDGHEGIKPGRSTHQKQTDLVANSVRRIYGEATQKHCHDSEEYAWRQAKGILRRCPLHCNWASYDGSEDDEVETALPSRQRLPHNGKDHTSRRVPSISQAKAESNGGQQRSQFESIILWLGGQKRHESVLTDDEDKIVDESHQHSREYKLDRGNALVAGNW